ncbi:DUF5819 family protein [Melittangium boletus]|uniref:DUF5819 family protein n=1 Tax=Melittangium boletus TaxID=83453 RepID=UPI003DA3E459
MPALLLGGLALHFSLTLAFLTPLNPIKLRLLPLIDGYIQPFFNQRWSLFAPNLEAKTRYLLVSCRGEDARGVSTERPWMNITLPLHELKQRYRLTPADRLERAQMVGVNQLEVEDDELSRKLLEKPADTAEYRAAVAFVEQQREGRKRAGMRLLRRVASRACAELYPELAAPGGARAHGHHPGAAVLPAHGQRGARGHPLRGAALAALRGAERAMSPAQTTEATAPGWDALVEWMARPRLLIGASLFRLIAGAAILIEYLINYAQRGYLFGPGGLFPFAPFVAEMERGPSFSLYAWSGSPVYFEAVYHLGILVAALWMLGWHTRLLTPLNYVFLWSLHQRASGIWDGGDNIIHLILVYAMFADVGAYFSLDASGGRRAVSGPPGPGARALAMLHTTAMLAFAVQISLVYGIAGLYKVQGGVWQDGTALYYAFRGGQFVWPGVTEWFYRDALVVTAVTYTTVAYQVAFPFLLFLNRSTRRVAVVLGFTFHLGIALFLGLVTFSLFMTSVDLALMGDDEYRALGRWLTQLQQRFSTRSAPAPASLAPDVARAPSSSTSPPPG